ncbi:MAG: chromosomal replication initiator protein DnaA [Acutalibacteraceae bacterium]|nr:chromosomal replication initiator protein DnaA [Acutalibacteraceae bacterium]
MSANPLDQIWSAICDECKKSISEVAFNCFLKDLVPVFLSDGEFTISINDEYKKGVIEQTYLQKLNEAIKTVMGVQMVARIVLDEDEEEILKAEEYSEGLSFEDFFTFNNFIVGSTNRFAHAAALAVADNPNIIYNPLVIYGPSGVGKTHLMLAIKNHIKNKFPNKKIEFIRGEEFTNELIKALQDGKLGLGTIDDFRNKFRNVDVLLIDDIHFIAGKEQTQEEFFNTFNVLYQKNKQIVVSLDRPIKDIKTLDERIRSRLQAGLPADITPPDFETRVGIINKKAEQMGIELEKNLVFYIAEHIKVNTRQLEGVVKKLQAYITIQKKIPNISVVQTFIKDIVSDDKPEPIKIDEIIVEVAKTYNVSPTDILSNRRTASLVLARQVAMYIARETTELSYKSIGESFAKDHTTVLYNVNKIEEFLRDRPYQKELVDDIIKNLKSRKMGSY